MLHALRSRQPALLLVAITVLAYVPVLWCGFVWDDDDYVTQNPLLRTAGGIADIWVRPTALPQYYPFVHSTFWLEYRLWGTHPLGYHVDNVLLHALASVLLWRLLRRLAVPGALFAAALFAVHPVHVESVAWITERKNVLSLCCYLAAAGAWLDWRDAAQGAGGAPRRAPAARYVVASAWFVLALLSKTVTASLPAALLLVVWWRDGRVRARDVRSLLPWFAAGLALGWLTVHLEQTHVGAAGAAWDLGAAERLLVAGRACWFYLGSLLWPAGLCFNYERWRLDATSPAQWAWPLAAAALLAVLWLLRHRIGRAPVAAALFFGGTLLPALGFFDVYPFRYSFVADHFQYHASIGPLALFAGAAATAAGTLGWPELARRAGAALPVAALAVATALQIPKYRDLETLFAATLRCNPASLLAHANLGKLALDRGDRATARRLLQRALELEPDGAEQRTNLGVLAFQEGDVAGARDQFERTLATRPDYVPALGNLAFALHTLGERERALALAQRAVALGPEHYEAHVVLAIVLHGLGRFAEALRPAEWVLQRTPQVEETRLLVVDCLLRLGRSREALQNATIAARFHPADPDVQAALRRAEAAR